MRGNVISFNRVVTETEIKRGFLYIPVEFQDYCTNGYIELECGNKTFMTVCDDYGRLWGNMKEVFSCLGVDIGDEIEVIIQENGFRISKVGKFNKKLSYEECSYYEEVKDYIYPNAINNIQKGKIVECRIGEIITISSCGCLSIYEPVADYEGIDAIVKPNYNCKFSEKCKEEYNCCEKVICLQIKGSFKKYGNKIIVNIRENSLCDYNNFYIMVVYYDLCKMDIDDPVLIIPAMDILKNDKLFPKTTFKNEIIYRIKADLGNKNDLIVKKYGLKKIDVGKKLLSLFC